MPEEAAQFSVIVKIVAFLSVFGLGMCFSILGSVSVKLMPRLGIDQGKFGSLISAFMFSCLVASLIVGVSLDSLGFKPIAVFGFIAVAVCFFLLSRAESYGTVLFTCILLGFGAMAVNTTGNTLGPQVLFGGENPARASNLLNVFFGVGLFVTPLITSLLFRVIAYKHAVSVLALVILAAIPAALSDYPTSPGFQLGDAVGLLTQPAAIVAGLVLFCYIGLEASLCNWLAPFGKEVITSANSEIEEDAADASAGRMLSVFAICMMASRFAASQIPGLTPSYLIAGCAAFAVIVIGVMVVCKTPGLAYVTAALAGASFGPCFPTTVGATFAKFEPAVYGSLFGIIFAIGLLGAVLIPKVLGNMATGSSVQKSMKLLLLPAIILIVLALVLGNIGGPATADDTPQDDSSPADVSGDNDGDADSGDTSPSDDAPDASSDDPTDQPE